MNARTRWLVIILLLVMFAQLTLGARHLSMTSDEPSHTVAGITYLATGELWIPPLHGHPPLINALAALPLLLQPDLPPFQTLEGWGNNFSNYVRATWPLLGPIERLAFVTRLPVMLMALLMAALVFRWACEAFGSPAGILAVSLMAFDPNLIAHAQLNTTDLGMALMGLASLYVAWKAALSQRLSLKWLGAVACGILFGLALAAKGSGFVYGPAILATVTWGYASKWWAQRRLTHAGHWIGQSALICITALLILWGVYRFEVGPLPGSHVRVPFPSHFGLWQIIFRDIKRAAFLRGETKVGGWWWYFPYSTAVKTPIPLLVGLVLTVIFWLKSGPRRWWQTLPLWAFPALYWLVAIRSQMNIGHRHMLPTYPFLYILVGQMTETLTAPLRQAKRVLRQTLAAILLIWYIVEAVRIYPFYLAYFNQFAGGSKNGYRHLADSNVDWGQSFIALRDFMESEAIDEVKLSYYTYVDPAVYGVQYEPLPPALGASEDVISRFAPQPAVYAIGATPLQGVMTAQTDLYDWFRHREPDAQVGYGLLIYDVRPEEVAVEWVAQCTAPVAPLSQAEVLAGEGLASEGLASEGKRVHIVHFDCTQAWIYPGGGESPGHYILTRDSGILQAPFVQSMLRRENLVYEQKLPGALPAFTVYGHHGEGISIPQTQPVQSAPSAWPPVQVLAAGVQVQPPVTLNGPLVFLGTGPAAGSYRAGDTVEMDTYWRVTGSPGERWPSIMAHLLAEDGHLVAGNDGLGVQIDQWQAGDVIVQHHTLALPADTPAGRYWLETGVYWLDSLERWSVLQQGNAVGDRLIVGEIQVETR